MNKIASILVLLILIISILPNFGLFVSADSLAFYGSINLCLLWIVFWLSWHKSTTFNISLSEILIICFIFYVSVHAFVRQTFQPDLLISFITLFLFFVLTKRHRWNNRILAAIALLGFSEASYGILKYFIIGPINFHDFGASGSFDNPAGFAASLIATLPFALSTVRIKKIKVIGLFFSFIIIVAILFSKSRTGILALTLLMIIQLLRFKPRYFGNMSKIQKSCSITFSLLIIIIGLYCINKDSANGRLLIWNCSFNMIHDKPLFGFGQNGFLKEYIFFQAEYFSKNPESPYTALADNAKHPFNEFLLLLINHGIIGTILICLFFHQVWQTYIHNRFKTLLSQSAFISIVSVGIFSLFSYPFSYPFVRLIFVFSLGLAMHNEKRYLLNIHTMTKIVGIAGLLILLSTNFYIMVSEYKWNKIAHRSLTGLTKEVMPEYQHLYRVMFWHPLFLYNLAAELNQVGAWRMSNHFFTICSHRMNDLDVQLWMAENYIQLQSYNNAEECLILATNLVPNRFIPLYWLQQIYVKTGNKEKAQYYANLIINKPVKIKNTETLIIKDEMTKYLKELSKSGK